jgi:hypothetical protein
MRGKEGLKFRNFEKEICPDDFKRVVLNLSYALGIPNTRQLRTRGFSTLCILQWETNTGTKTC